MDYSAEYEELKEIQEELVKIFRILKRKNQTNSFEVNAAESLVYTAINATEEAAEWLRI